MGSMMFLALGDGIERGQHFKLLAGQIVGFHTLLHPFRRESIVLVYIFRRHSRIVTEK